VTTPTVDKAAWTLLIDDEGNDAIGKVTDSPEANTVLGRLKAIADGGGGASTIADGADVAQGTTTDAAASSSVAEDTTARTGISLFKGIKNVLLLLNAKLPSLGQTTKAGSIPVTLSSDEDTLGVSGPLTDAEMRASDVAVTLDGEKVLVDEDSLPASLTETTVTVAQGESESGEVDLAGAAIVTIYPPAAVEATTAQMSFKVGRVTGSRAQLNDEYGVKLVIPFTAAQPIRVPASMLPAVRFLSIVLETSGGVAVAQATAAREFVFVTRRV